MFLYLHEFWRKRFSISKIQVLKNTDFCLKPNFNITKMIQIVYNMCWILLTLICKKTSFQHLKSLARLHWRSTGRSTGPGVGQPSRSTDGHGSHRKASHLAGRPRGRPTDSTPLSGGGQSTGRSTEGTTVIKMTVGRLTERSTGRSFLTFPGCQRADFWEGINTHLLSWFLYGFREQKFSIFLSI